MLILVSTLALNAYSPADHDGKFERENLQDRINVVLPASISVIPQS